MEWRNLYRGFVMGTSDLIPGVSGGTIAVMLGIYDRLLEAISGFFSADWRRHLGFLIPLALGMGAALLSLSRVISYLLERHFVPTQFFFMGLVIGVLPSLFRQADARRRFSAPHWAGAAVAALAVASMAWLDGARAEAPIIALSATTAVPLFLAGWSASMAMLLPGISGSFVLLVIGVYPTAIHALSTFDIPLITVIGLGVVTGFILGSKAIRLLLRKAPSTAYAVIIGLIVGSVVVIYPGLAGPGVMAASAVTFLIGLGLTAIISNRNGAA